MCNNCCKQFNCCVGNLREDVPCDDYQPDEAE